jgi:alkylated DNA repair dioxygenase AlkB
MEKIINNLGAGDSYLVYDVLPENIAKNCFELVKNEIGWNEMYHHGGKVPRLISVQGTIQNDTEPLYRHPADEQPKLIEWTKTVDQIRMIIEKLIGQKLNHALIQYYRNGNDWISEHSDKTLDVTRGTRIVNLSLGATRTMILRSKKADETSVRPKQCINLTHNSLFVLGWNTNKEMLHSIRQDKRSITEKTEDELIENGERISLTFRSIATFMQNDGKIFGQGAKYKTVAELADTCIINEPESEAEAIEILKCFSKENREINFDWDENYGKGFDTINFKILRTDKENIN